MWRYIRMTLAGIAGAYILVLAGLILLMLQPPARFALGIAKVPGPLFSVIPFRQLWTWARAGQLQIGDPAPDFNLETFERNGHVQLSSFRGKKPVVLAFGSYT
jgi:hypothetical protein